MLNGQGWVRLSSVQSGKGTGERGSLVLGKRGDTYPRESFLQLGPSAGRGRPKELGEQTGEREAEGQGKRGASGIPLRSVNEGNKHKQVGTASRGKREQTDAYLTPDDDDDPAETQAEGSRLGDGRQPTVLEHPALRGLQ